jgi:hypothetical protein
MSSNWTQLGQNGSNWAKPLSGVSRTNCSRVKPDGTVVEHDFKLYHYHTGQALVIRMDVG